MKPLLIVDGYNILGAWKLAEKRQWGIEEARDQLQHRLADYAGYTGCEVLLVFDGYQSDRKQRSQEQQGAVTVVFTKHGETADQYIEATATRHPRYRPLQVATSDGVEQTIVLGRGAVRISARELLQDIQHIRTQGSRETGRREIKRNTLESFLTPEQQEILEKMRRQK